MEPVGVVAFHTHIATAAVPNKLSYYSVHKPFPTMKEMNSNLTTDVIQPPTQSHIDASSLIHTFLHSQHL